DAHPDVIARPVERIGQLEQRLGPEGVAHLGAADGDLGDALGGLVRDVAVVARGDPLDGPVALFRKLHGENPRYRPALWLTSWRWPCPAGRPSCGRCSGCGTGAPPPSRSTCGSPSPPSGPHWRPWR